MSPGPEGASGSVIPPLLSLLLRKHLQYCLLKPTKEHRVDLLCGCPQRIWCLNNRMGTNLRRLLVHQHTSDQLLSRPLCPAKERQYPFFLYNHKKFWRLYVTRLCRVQSSASSERIQVLERPRFLTTISIYSANPNRGLIRCPYPHAT